MNKHRFEKGIDVFYSELIHVTNHRCPTFSFDDNYGTTHIMGSIYLNKVDTPEKTYYLLDRDSCENVYLKIDDSDPIRLNSVFGSDLFRYNYRDLGLSIGPSSELSEQLIQSVCNAKDVTFIFEMIGTTYSSKKSIYYAPGFIIPYFQACFDTLISPGTYSDCYERLKKKDCYLVYKKPSLFSIF